VGNVTLRNSGRTFNPYSSSCPFNEIARPESRAVFLLGFLGDGNQAPRLDFGQNPEHVVDHVVHLRFVSGLDARRRSSLFFCSSADRGCPSPRRRLPARAPDGSRFLGSRFLILARNIRVTRSLASLIMRDFSDSVRRWPVAAIVIFFSTPLPGLPRGPRVCGPIQPEVTSDAGHATRSRGNPSIRSRIQEGILHAVSSSPS